VNSEYADEHAFRAWAADEITWGIFDVPETQLGVLGDVAGLDVVELGCGTAYLSAWLARRGARPTGVDLTAAQLDTARRCQDSAGRGVEFHPSHGQWITILRTAGFVVDALHELYAAPGARTHPYYGIASPQWASRWPAEELWAARLAEPGASRSW
jgi:SAM-dependent methyltransferase